VHEPRAAHARQAAVKLFIVVFFVFYFGAVFLRVDYFPLSWVPMYGQRSEHPVATFRIGDLQKRTEGFAAIRANGETLNISQYTLNIPKANFRRLYSQRAFNIGPPQHNRERAALMPFNRWWMETLVGPDPLHGKNYPKRLLDSINETFGYGPEDPLRIVQLVAHTGLAEYTQAQLDAGDLSQGIRTQAFSTITPAGTDVTVDGVTTHLVGYENSKPLQLNDD
jgi:hypothetical protein